MTRHLLVRRACVQREPDADRVHPNGLPLLQQEERQPLLHGDRAEKASVLANLSKTYSLDGPAFYLAE